MDNFLVTGALGFIGSNFVNYYLNKYPDVKIVILDKMDYCSSKSHITNDKAIIVVGNILDEELVAKILKDHKINMVVHFAAESHVDNSFNNSLAFTKNNVVGTHTLLEETRKYHVETNAIKKFIHVSTDEVYGEVVNNRIRTEESILKPTNPYAASKGGAEFIVNSYYESYKLPIIITRANNVYGQNQYPEKVIPKFICQLLDGNPVTIQGDGSNRRNFIHVDDVSTAYDTIIQNGVIGETYNISAFKGNEFSVMEIAKILIKILNKDEETSIIYVADRNINDRRYYTSSEKLEKLGWMPTKTNFIDHVTELIEWYIINRSRYGKI